MSDKEIIRLGRWSEGDLDRFIREAALISDAGLRIAHISREFLGIPYQGFTLVGDCATAERLVINLEGVDCFTFIDYVEAMRLARTFAAFRENLLPVRYRKGRIAFEERHHFFSDWIKSRSAFVHDITATVAGGGSEVAEKTLNVKEDGSLYLPGLAGTTREIRYVPGGQIDARVRERLRTGDYVGIYTDLAGLDVSHVGIFIRERDKEWFRHASSAEAVKRVVDQDFEGYVATKPGIVVLRPIEPAGTLP